MTAAEETSSRSHLPRPSASLASSFSIAARWSQPPSSQHLYTRRTIVLVTAEGQQRRQEASGEATEVSPSSGKESRIASTPTSASPIASDSRAADYARRHPRTVALRSAQTSTDQQQQASRQTNRQPTSATRRRTTTAALQSIHPRNSRRSSD
ncbi:uncharacterized protein LOC119768631 [Culex quinquefasciatus]|uniref:uncharacterized protein LOC119768631 n=1 Tax=Culex quinquefasciatus TaxID=7176 RepID=UPI0018E37524|nr:uncharacterized protein LOC119768631 [Culex quinquefasciatus]